MHSEPAPGAAEHDAGIKLTVWVHYATEHEHARDRAERADTERKMLFDLAVDDLLAQARVRGEKLPIANAERAVAISPEYRKAIDAAHRLRLEAGIARIAEGIATAARQQLDVTIAEVQRFAGQCFDEKSQQYNRYAADMEKGLDNEIADLEVRVKELREQSRDQSLALDQKLALQREASRLDRQRDEMLADRFARKRKIQDEVDKMLDRVAESLKLEPQIEPLFTLRWELTR